MASKKFLPGYQDRGDSTDKPGKAIDPISGYERRPFADHLMERDIDRTPG
jgi:hypothetical protein